MASKGQFTGMTGAFLVAAQLSSRRFVASTTSRNAAGADILVTDADCLNAFSVQVKTNGKRAAFWILGRKEPTNTSATYVYAFVNLFKYEQCEIAAEYYLVPSNVVCKVARFGGDKWPNYSVYREDIKKYRNEWSIFENR
jgi:hypothetical protein